MAYIHKPTVPFQSILDGPLVPGNKLELVGQVPLEAKRFEVNLKTEDGRILLHVNPRLDQEKVVLNSNIKKWGSEEIPDLFPFAPGAHFSLVIESKQTELEIFVNGNSIARFEHRGDPKDIELVQVTGDVQLELFQEHPKSQLAVPYYAPLDSEVNNVSISGKMIGDSFEVNLKSGSDTLLHFNPDVSKGAVVRNSKVDGEWDDDETDGGMPFQLGEIFNIHIIITEEEFVVLVNQNQFCKYPYHTDDELESIEIEGDVELQSCST